jgi:hypothetical protein
MTIGASKYWHLGLEPKIDWIASSGAGPCALSCSLMFFRDKRHRAPTFHRTKGFMNKVRVSLPHRHAIAIFGHSVGAVIPSGKLNNTISEIMVATFVIVGSSAYHL